MAGAPGRPGGCQLIGFGLGLGLSAWFWLPAIAEKGLVQLSEIVEPDLFASFFITSFPPFRLDLLYDYREPVSTALGYPIFWPQVGMVQAACRSWESWRRCGRMGWSGACCSGPCCWWWAALC